MKQKKLVAFIAACSMVMMSLVGCGGNNAEQNADTILLGGSFALTGEVSQYGIAASRGAELAIEEYNANGGVLGKQIKFILEDNKGSQPDAASAFKKLVEKDKVVAFLGSDVSSTTETIANVASEVGIPMITPTGTKLDITTIGDNIFRACFVDPYQGQVLAQFAADDLSSQKAALMVNSEVDYSVGISETFKEAFTSNGGEIAVSVNYSEADIDFKPILANVKNADVDVVVVPDYYEKIALITAQAREIGIDATFIGGDGWDGVTTQTANNPQVVEGSYFINHYSPDAERQEVKDFISNYEAKYNETPNAFAALGYDGAKLMLEAMEKAGSTDYEAVNTALKGIEIEGVTGKITFDEVGNPIKSVAIIKIEDGKNTLYKTLDPK